jgi:hypothetical protein
LTGVGVPGAGLLEADLVDCANAFVPVHRQSAIRATNQTPTTVRAAVHME